MKVTKKQRKQQARNAMVQRSMSKGSRIVISGVEYFGKKKLFNEFGEVIQSGMPFVRRYA